MRRLLWTRRAALSAGWHLGCPGGWEIALDVVWGWWPWYGVLMLGWGGDSSFPLSLVPAVRLGHPLAPRSGMRPYGLVFLGFFAVIFLPPSTAKAAPPRRDPPSWGGE